MYLLSSAIAISFLAMFFKPTLLLFVLSLTNLSVRCTRTCQKGQYIGRYNICRDCPPGTFQDEPAGIGIDSCKPCPKGKVSRKWGRARCVSCPKNREAYASGYESSCSCIDGTVLKPNRQCEFCKSDEKTFTPENTIGCESCGLDTEKHPGLSKCIKCPKGQVIINNKGECGLCPPGWEFSPGVNRRRGYECSFCKYGHFKSTHGQHLCKKCPQGGAVRQDATECIFCPKGTIYDSDADKCKACPPGRRYKSLFQYCEECDPGTFQPNAGVSERCLECPKGSLPPMEPPIASSVLRVKLLQIPGSVNRVLQARNSHHPMVHYRSAQSVG